MSTTQLTILSGDSKLELFQQLLDIGRIRRNAPYFQVMVQHPILTGSTAHRALVNLDVQGITAESGDGECWDISGYVEQECLNGIPWMLQLFPQNQSNRFVGWYNTKRRQGFLKPASGR
jgi:hypothetical protein